MFKFSLAGDSNLSQSSPSGADKPILPVLKATNKPATFHVVSGPWGYDLGKGDMYFHQ